jgi:hypothetical protein
MLTLQISSYSRCRYTHHVHAGTGSNLAVLELKVERELNPTRACAGEVANANGKIKSVKLVVTAENSAQRIGAPTPLSGPTSVRFTRRLLLDSGHVVYEHHPRALEPRDQA